MNIRSAAVSHWFAMKIHTSIIANREWCRGRSHGRPRGRPAGIGLMLYLKLSLTGDEAELLKRYRLVHPDFPHQSTLDQFYDEEQFEAYRQLGVHVADGLFSRALMSGTHPTSVPQWFRQ